MPVELLESEVREIQRERAGRSQTEFNEWFGKSLVKARLKKACMKAQRFRCCYCMKFTNSDSAKIWDLEHILCESLYPQFYSTLENLAVSCQRCNTIKSQKDVLVSAYGRPPLSVPSISTDYKIPHPHLTVWSQHLRQTLHILYEGITPEGKELLDCCKLNGDAEHVLQARVGTVKVAAENNVFDMIGVPLPGGSVIDGEKLASLVAEVTENAHTENLMVKIEKTLQTMRRAAERRNPAPGGEKVITRKRKKGGATTAAAPKK
ncbi:hypothetical protein RGK87_26655 [Agrobacterium fabacearum]|uniref:HNH endonuclease n=1 Tax=Agrobacterium tumefaciens TaxID=358 RepID=UPI00285355D1|nr:hypothetical protein [Agrobacterium tumefaciens]MDR5012600.1 hypothetical protein [Agrobacterium tumefaciens]